MAWDFPGVTTLVSRGLKNSGLNYPIRLLPGSYRLLWLNIALGSTSYWLISIFVPRKRTSLSYALLSMWWPCSYMRAPDWSSPPEGTVQFALSSSFGWPEADWICPFRKTSSCYKQTLLLVSREDSGDRTCSYSKPDVVENSYYWLHFFFFFAKLVWENIVDVLTGVCT